LQLPVFSMGDLHTTHQQNNTAVSWWGKQPRKNCVWTAHIY
jgi:hypothetical protein